MDWKLLLQVGASITVAAVGWIIVHWLNSERDARNKRAEIRLKHLVEIYRKLERSLGSTINSNTTVSQELLNDICTAVADLQLFGDADQVETAKAIARSFQVTHTESLDLSSLISELCNAIRKELRLSPLSEKLLHLRLTYRSNTPISDKTTTSFDRQQLPTVNDNSEVGHRKA